MVRRKGRVRERATSSKKSRLHGRIEHWEKLKSKGGSNWESANRKPGTSDCKK